MEYAMLSFLQELNIYGIICWLELEKHILKNCKYIGISSYLDIGGLSMPPCPCQSMTHLSVSIDHR